MRPTAVRRSAGTWAGIIGSPPAATRFGIGQTPLEQPWIGVEIRVKNQSVRRPAGVP